MAEFLVTGGCGFIGSHLVDALLADGHRVRVLDDLSSGRRDNLDGAAELVVGDVASRETVAEAVAGADGIFHLAAVASVQQSIEDWPRTHAVNLSGSVHVFDAARRASPDSPPPVVYASSAAVYGSNPDLPLREEAQKTPLSAYGADKYGCELHAEVARGVHGVPTLGLRFFNVYGPRQDPSSPYSGVISIFAERLIRGLPVTIFGDGEQTRDFVFVADVVAHLRRGMHKAGSTSPVLNVCSGRATSVNALAATLGEIIGRSPDIRYETARAGDIRASLGEPSRASAELGVRAETGLHEGLRRTIAALGDR